MTEYSQPDFYHFSQDSIFLAKEVAWRCHQKTVKACEVFAGSGVVSLEAMKRGMKCSSLDLVELQEEFFGHAQKNFAALTDFAPWRWHSQSYHDFFATCSDQYDLIYANPPFYPPSSYRVSSHPGRRRCRSFEVGSLEEFLITAMAQLAPQGHLLMLSLTLPFALQGLVTRQTHLYKDVYLYEFVSHG